MQVIKINHSSMVADACTQIQTSLRTLRHQSENGMDAVLVTSSRQVIWFAIFQRLGMRATHAANIQGIKSRTLVFRDNTHFTASSHKSAPTSFCFKPHGHRSPWNNYGERRELRAGLAGAAQASRSRQQRRHIGMNSLCLSGAPMLTPLFLATISA